MRRSVGFAALRWSGAVAVCAAALTAPASTLAINMTPAAVTAGAASGGGSPSGGGSSSGTSGASSSSGSSSSPGSSSSSGSGSSGHSGGGGLPSPGESTNSSGHKSKGRWITGFQITEYWPTPESWFVGKKVKAPGIPGRHRIDWLYSATGVSMEGDGTALNGQAYHINSTGNVGWITSAGKPTLASNGFNAGAPFWRAGGYWRNSKGGVTFPLSAGGWFSGAGKRYVPLRGVTFAPGPSLPLRFYQSIAVDPTVIPLGSRVYIPAYKNDGHGGWFTAQDTGGAINGRRIDVYRPPPASPDVGGQSFSSQRVLVIKP